MESITEVVTDVFTLDERFPQSKSLHSESPRNLLERDESVFQSKIIKLKLQRCCQRYSVHRIDIIWRLTSKELLL